MAQDLRHQHPPHVLHLQVRPRAHEERRHHHQLRLRQRLHRPPGPARLHLEQGRHRLLHPRAIEPATLVRDPGQRRRPGSRLDPAHPVDHEGIRNGPVQRDPHGAARSAIRNSHLLCLFSESR